MAHPLLTQGHGLHARVARRARPARTPVTLYVPSALWDWHGRLVHAAGMGASEKSLVLVAEALAAWRRVEVYGPVPDPDTCARVRYWPREQIRHARRDSTVIVSRAPLAGPTLADAMGAERPLLLWLQDAWYPELTAAVAEAYARIVVVSEWHRQAMHSQHGVPLDRMVVIPNPLDPALYQGAGPRKADRVIYASSPDRGLVRLLRLWPELRRRLPDATLDVYYGWRGCERLGLGQDPAWTQRYERARREFERLRWQPGVAIHDMVAPATLARAWQEAGVWAYPTDFAETFGTVAVEARAGGCVPVCPPLAGLAESAACPQTVWTPAVEDPAFDEAFVAGVVRAATVSEEERQTMAGEALARFAVERIAPQWEALLR